MAITASARTFDLPHLAGSLIILLLPSASWACFDCRAAVAAQVYGTDFVINLLALLMPLLILGLAGFAALHWDAILHRLRNDRPY